MNNLATLTVLLFTEHFTEWKNEPKVEYNTDIHSVPNLLKSYLHINQYQKEKWAKMQTFIEEETEVTKPENVSNLISQHEMNP